MYAAAPFVDMLKEVGNKHSMFRASNFKALMAKRSHLFAQLSTNEQSGNFIVILKEVIKFSLSSQNSSKGLGPNN